MSLKGMCRTCLCSDGVMYPLFAKDAVLMHAGSRTTVEILEMLTFVQIYNKDHLPDHICDNCLNEVQRAYLFKLQCERSETILHQLKEVQINLRKLDKISNRCQSKTQSNIELCIIKNELEEKVNFFDHENINIKYDISEIELEHNQVAPNLQCVNVENTSNFEVIFKNEPELQIEDIQCAKNDLENDEKFKCLDCGKVCQSVNILLGHVITEHIKGKRCQICSEEFKSSKFLHSVKHIPPSYLNEFEIVSDLGGDGIKEKENCTTNKRKYCPQCFEHFIDLKLLELHIFVKHIPPEFECSICTRILMDQNDYNKHRKEHKKQVQCEICFKVLSTRSYLGQHMRIHTGDKPFQCKLCSEKFRLNRMLNVHMETKHKNELSSCKSRYQCSICMKALSTSSHRAKHMRTHTGEKPFQCKLCPEKFRVGQSLRSHIEMNHLNELPDVKPRYQCNICSKILGSKSHLKAHIRIHTGEKPYKCKLCSENFRSGQSLNSHMVKIHINDLPDLQPKYQCKVCSKIFARNANLQSHMQIHSGTKPFECNLCQEKYRIKQSLRRHMSMKHKNELADCQSKYQCKVCSKIFARQINLTIHMRIHTGAKPFECKFCSEKFRHKHKMRVHMETKHINELPNCKPKYQCTICSKIFDYNRTLRIHLKSKHSNVAKPIESRRIYNTE